ncbi:MAG: hypothetical protein A4S09_14130 [Proteobacteria bacterium SG_bin7]|nr:MAG: hypothetical protein A4S09_14130 [Proteobacteria bacterium SG_bin7]
MKSLMFAILFATPIFVFADKYEDMKAMGVDEATINFSKKRDLAQANLKVADYNCKKKFQGYQNVEKYAACYQSAQAQYLKDIEAASNEAKESPGERKPAQKKK